MSTKPGTTKETDCSMQIGQVCDLLILVGKITRYFMFDLLWHFLLLVISLTFFFFCMEKLSLKTGRKTLYFCIFPLRLAT